MGLNVKVTSNADAVISAKDMAVQKALEMIGLAAEGYAKLLSPVGTPESTGIPGYVGGTLRNSIAHEVMSGESAVAIGTNVEYAPYVELGTRYQRAQPYLSPAVEEHLDEYRTIAENELRNA